MKNPKKRIAAATVFAATLLSAQSATAGSYLCRDRVSATDGATLYYQTDVKRARRIEKREGSQACDEVIAEGYVTHELRTAVGAVYDTKAQTEKPSRTGIPNYILSGESIVVTGRMEDGRYLAHLPNVDVQLFVNYDATANQLHALDDLKKWSLEGAPYITPFAKSYFHKTDSLGAGELSAGRVVVKIGGRTKDGRQQHKVICRSAPCTKGSHAWMRDDELIEIMPAPVTDRVVQILENPNKATIKACGFSQTKSEVETTATALMAEFGIVGRLKLGGNGSSSSQSGETTTVAAEVKIELSSFRYREYEPWSWGYAADKRKSVDISLMHVTEGCNGDTPKHRIQVMTNGKTFSIGGYIRTTFAGDAKAQLAYYKQLLRHLGDSLPAGLIRHLAMSESVRP